MRRVKLYTVRKGNTFSQIARRNHKGTSLIPLRQEAYIQTLKISTPDPAVPQGRQSINHETS